MIQTPEKPPSSWKEVEERINELREKAAEKLDSEEFFGKIFAFATKLQTNHPDYNKYKCYHTLIGSSYPPGSLDGDFEGEDSMEAFFESLLAE